HAADGRKGGSRKERDARTGVDRAREEPEVRRVPEGRTAEGSRVRRHAEVARADQPERRLSRVERRAGHHEFRSARRGTAARARGRSRAGTWPGPGDTSAGQVVTAESLAED